MKKNIQNIENDIDLERILVIDGISSLIPKVKNKVFIRYTIQKIYIIVKSPLYILFKTFTAFYLTIINFTYLNYSKI